MTKITEKVLQSLLEKHPDLLSFGRSEPREPCQWILVGREIGIPAAVEGAERWHLDHLFLDRAAIPTLVEVKTSTNVQIRREIVGQMIEYAAHAARYWPPEVIESRFRRTCSERGEDPVGKIADLVGIDGDDGRVVYHAYWRRVGDNIRAGRLRLVFFADRIPRELRNMVAFLDEQTGPAEVWAVEIHQFIHENREAIEQLSSALASSLDAKSGGPDFDRLYEIAESQAGYFSAAQGAEAGYSWERLSMNTRAGRFQRVRHGVYRLVHFPGSRFEDLFLAHLGTGPHSVISHESALSVYNVSDVLPSEVHVTIPRTGSRRRRGIRLHTNRLEPDEIIMREGLPITTVARTIADVARSGLAEEQVRLAIREALQQGLTTKEDLCRQADRRGGRAAQLIAQTLHESSDENQ